jgi:hypothetical protein
MLAMYGHDTRCLGRVPQVHATPQMDPIGFWLKQRKAGEAIGNLSATALVQTALDYISVPGLYFEMSFTCTN